ncbi:MFS transporter [Nocardia sp. NPDC001965]
MRTTAAPGTISAGTLVLLTALYFAQGLPYGFFTQALPVVLRESGFSLIQISATGILFAPWALKFLWAPYIDHYGTRRQWLLTLQLTASAVTLGLACLDLSSSLRWLLVGIAVINAVSATQDIATDGLAVQLLGPRQRGLGNGIQVGAYRIGMIVGGGALLWLFALAGWRSLFVAMSVLLLATAIPVWWSPRTPVRSTPRKISPSPARLVLGWWKRLRRPGMIAFILLIGGFKFGDSMGSAMVGPYMSDTGLTLGQIALVKGVLSSAGALGGAALGGWLCYRYGRRRALLVGGITQTTSLALYLFSALGIGGFELIVTASLAEHILGGAATVAVFTLMMDASDPDHAGSDYTLLACAVVTVQGIAGFAAGTVGELLGYPALFGTSLVLSGIGCATMIIATDRGAGPAGIHTVWAPSARTSHRPAPPLVGGG